MRAFVTVQTRTYSLSQARRKEVAAKIKAKCAERGFISHPWSFREYQDEPWEVLNDLGLAVERYAE